MRALFFPALIGLAVSGATWAHLKEGRRLSAKTSCRGSHFGDPPEPN